MAINDSLEQIVIRPKRGADPEAWEKLRSSFLEEFSEGVWVRRELSEPSALELLAPLTVYLEPNLIRGCIEWLKIEIDSHLEITLVIHTGSGDVVIPDQNDKDRYVRDTSPFASVNTDQRLSTNSSTVRSDDSGEESRGRGESRSH